MKKLTEADITTPAWSIDDMPNLKGRLGKARSDKIRFNSFNRNDVGTKRTRWVDNPHMEYMQGFEPNQGGAVDDIISGAANLSLENEVRLSASRLHNLLAAYNRISTDLIKLGLGINDSQARRYLSAARVAIQNLTRHRNGIEHETP